MKILKYIGLTVLSLIVLTSIYVYYLSIQRDTSTWIEDIQVSENVKIPIELMTSQKKYYGGHAFGWGGGDVKNYIKFMYNDIEYVHKTPYIPVVIKLYKDDFFIIYFDRETDFSKITYRFYKSQINGSFLEIKATEFPKHLAIQNRWFHENSDDTKEEKIIGLNPEKMKNTMTASIWYMIEGKQSIFNGYIETPIDFIKKYKTENFTKQKKQY